MNTCTASVFTAFMAATFADKSALSKCVAGAAGFTTVFGAQKFVETIGSKVATSLEENNYLSFAGDVHTKKLKALTQSICQIAINTCSLFSLLGTFLISSLTTIGIHNLQNKLRQKEEAPPLFDNTPSRSVLFAQQRENGELFYKDPYQGEITLYKTHPQGSLSHGEILRTDSGRFYGIISDNLQLFSLQKNQLILFQLQNTQGPVGALIPSRRDFQVCLNDGSYISCKLQDTSSLELGAGTKLTVLVNRKKFELTLDKNLIVSVTCIQLT
jgi:hypothetical protein